MTATTDALVWKVPARGEPLSAMMGGAHVLRRRVTRPGGLAGTKVTIDGLAAIGIVASLGLVALIPGAAVSSIRVPWQRIAARGLGSWVAAIGLLALAWTLRPAA